MGKIKLELDKRKSELQVRSKTSQLWLLISEDTKDGQSFDHGSGHGRSHRFMKDTLERQLSHGTGLNCVLCALIMS